MEGADQSEFGPTWYSRVTPLPPARAELKFEIDVDVCVIGGGLAGSEAAWQIATADIPVVIHEMRPDKMTDAHNTDAFAELVCSNSLRTMSVGGPMTSPRSSSAL